MHEHLRVELARSREQDIAHRTRYAFQLAELEAHRRAEAEAQRRLRPSKLAWLAVVRRWMSRPQPGEVASDA
jgi:hypothetical protein